MEGGETSFARLGSQAFDACGEAFVSSLYPVASQLSLPRANSEAEFQDFLKRIPSSTALDEPSPTQPLGVLPRVPSLDFIRAFLSANRAMPELGQQTLCSPPAVPPSSLPPFDLDGPLALDMGRTFKLPDYIPAGAAGAAGGSPGCGPPSPSTSDVSDPRSPPSGRCAFGEQCPAIPVPATPCAGSTVRLGPLTSGAPPRQPVPQMALPFPPGSPFGPATLPISALHAEGPAARPALLVPPMPCGAGAPPAVLLAPGMRAAAAFMGQGPLTVALPQFGMMQAANVATAGGSGASLGTVAMGSIPAPPSLPSADTPTHGPRGGSTRGRKGEGGGGRRGKAAAAAVQQQQQQQEWRQEEEDGGEGATPGETLSEGEVSNRLEARRARRMMSNRESARRSRKRKQEHLFELEQQVTLLEATRVELVGQLSRMQEVLSRKDVEVAALSQEVEQLRQQNSALRGAAAAKAEQAPAMAPPAKRGRYAKGRPGAAQQEQQGEGEGQAQQAQLTAEEE